MLIALPNVSAKPSQIKPKYFFVFHLIKGWEKNTVKGYGYIMWNTPGGRVKVIGKYPITYGKNGVGKWRYKDLRTPIGCYKIWKISKMFGKDKKRYGSYNLSLDYPNRQDRKQGRKGSGIAIHGGHVNHTAGCIRVLDGTRKKPRAGYKNIAVFRKYSQQGTPVYICRTIYSGFLGKKGTYLSKRASRHWRPMMHTEYTSIGLSRRLRSY